MGHSDDAISGDAMAGREPRDPRGEPADWAGEIVRRLGGHPARTLGIDLARDPDAAWRWLLACCLLAGRADETRALATFRALEAAGLDRLEAAPAAQRLGAALRETRYPDPEGSARRLLRIARGVAHGESLSALAAQADDTPDLAARIAALAPGLGAATVTRFLRPLRDVWPAAAEVPLAPAARAAGVHLGLLREGQDEEGEPGALRAVLRDLRDPPDLADVEAALERLGSRACLRGRVARCPLGPLCPARSSAGT
jgi:hypothetical protein